MICANVTYALKHQESENRYKYDYDQDMKRQL